MSLPSPSRRTRVIDRSLRLICALALAVPVAAVLVLIAQLVIDLGGLGSDPGAGLGRGLVESLVLVGGAAALAVPLGLGAAVYFEEYGAEGRFGRMLETNLELLAGVPPVIYGLLGLEIFARGLDLGWGRGAAIATLALLLVPLVVTAARRGLAEVSGGQREAGLALGGTRWQVLRQLVLPAAMPRFASELLRALARALGEAAPLVMLAALAGEALGEAGGALPLQAFTGLSTGATASAAAACLALLAGVWALNLVAELLGRRVTTSSIRREELRP